MKIRVADKSVGECVISTTGDIPKSVEYAVKSLCVIQLMCLGSDQNDPKFKDFLDILKDTTKKLDILYNGTGEENEPDPFEQFQSNNG